MGFHSRRGVQSAGGHASAGCVGRNRSIRSSASQQSPAGRAVPLVVEEIDDSGLAMVKAVEVCLLPPSPLAHSYGRGGGVRGLSQLGSINLFTPQSNKSHSALASRRRIRSLGSLTVRCRSRSKVLGRGSASCCVARMERSSMSRYNGRMSG